MNAQLETNKRAHHTDVFHENSSLILRRGQPFQLDMRFNRAPDANDTIVFVALVGPQPSESNGTKLIFPLSSSVKSGSWCAVRDPGSTNPVKVSLISNADAIIGRYTIGVMISSWGYVTSHKLMNCTMLFNPWAQEDSVFMPDLDMIEEYVLSEHGTLYQGNVDYIAELGWNYGQYEKDILNIVFLMLDRNSNTDHEHRNDPGYIGRVCSALVNSNDENGVLLGDWSGNYSAEESPSRWSGSVEILRKWAASGPGPVRYGQCWVFAGVMCTVLRCLGIPTRVTTNFNSAHDTNSNLSIDEYYDTLGKYIGSPDSIWNFHVWNECFFKRKDLGSAKYDGWQVLDATPQETSSGIFQMGPTSVNAIKNGDVDLPYDGPFAFSEMNADRIYWIYDSANENLEKIYADTKSVGQLTRTKAVGSNTFEDVTGNYKHKEGSTEERLAYARATEKLFGPVFKPFAAADASRAAAPAPEIQPESEITIKFQKFVAPVIGQDISLVLMITNNTSATKAVKVHIDASCSSYTRREMTSFLSGLHSITLGPKEEKDISLKILYAQYKVPLTDDNVIEVTALCQPGQGARVLTTQNITLRSPSIKFKVDGPVVVNETVTVEVTFSNPLPEELKSCELHAEGSGLIASEMVQMLSMKPKETKTVPLDITPYKNGGKQLQVIIKCNKFLILRGYESIKVAEAS
ncbi:protein-glutamine gamma-glutamyltransferase E-like isoform X2 [Ambystoma mexicanum]